MTASIKALQYLHSEIEKLCTSGHNRLPTISMLASAARVSKGTMHKAVALTQKTGLITATQGKGILICNPQPPCTILSPRPAHNRMPALEHRILGDMLTGRYSNETLPLAKELMQTYGVCYATLKKALVTLVDQGLIRKQLKRYGLNPATGSTQSRVVLLAPADSSGILHSFSERMQLLVRSIEHEAQQKGLSVAVCSFDYANDRFLNPELLDPYHAKSSETTLGYLISANMSSMERVQSVIGTLSPHALPIALFDQYNTAHPSAGFLAAHRTLRFYRISDDTVAGKDTAVHLIRKGYHHVACIGLLHNSNWFRDRHAGLKQVFDKAGMGDNLIRISTPEPVVDERFNMENSHKADVFLDDFFTSIDPSLRASPEERIPIRMALVSSLAVARWFKDAPDLFEQALRNTRTRAWVCESDEMAQRALNYLRDRNIRVPEDIAVMGFDDIDAALSLGLTTYNFNDMQGAKAMIGQILGMPTMPAGVREKVISIPGFVISRKTL